jgi:hypothetical protein
MPYTDDKAQNPTRGFICTISRIASLGFELIANQELMGIELHP